MRSNSRIKEEDRGQIQSNFEIRKIKNICQNKIRIRTKYPNNNFLLGLRFSNEKIKISFFFNYKIPSFFQI